MKNIPALPALVIIFTALTAGNSVYCQEADKRSYVFSIGPQFGIVYGQAFEFVYPVPGTTKGELLSELIWDMKPVFYFGVQMDYSRADIMESSGFFSSLSFKYGIPADSGIMEDRDWLSRENGNLTHFSSHTNKTSEFYWLDAAAGLSMPLRSLLYIKPFISGSWMRFSFSGRGGYGIYPEGTKSFKGEVIRYKQDWFLIAGGFTAGTNILSPFFFDISFQITPFTYCAAMDEHLDESKRITYYDYTSWGLFLEPAGSVSFITRRMEISLEIAYRYIGRTWGESYFNSDLAKAGAGLSILNSRFLFKYRF